LKILPSLDPPQIIYDHEVPVLIKDMSPQLVKFWDLTLHQIMPFLDGMNHVKKIAQLGNVDSSFVKTSLRQLVYYEMIRMVDTFQFSNLYRIHKPEQLQKLYSSDEFQQTCLLYISPKNGDLRGSKGALDLVFSIFCQISSRCSVAELVRRNSAGLQRFSVNIKRIIMFGLLNDIIARVHKYPVLTSKFDYTSPEFVVDRSNQFALSMSPPTSILSSGGSSPNTRLPFSMNSYDMEHHLLSMLDGKHSMDRICCEFDKSLQEMNEILLRIPHITHLTM
jgi:hypothetical protein